MPLSPRRLRAAGSLLLGSLALAASPLAAAPDALAEDFETEPDTGILTCAALPAGWTQLDEDGRTPHESTAWVNQAWCVTGGVEASGNEAAVSNSWYFPAGAADDWLITPQIQLGTNPAVLWKGLSRIADFPETYEVRISTEVPQVLDFLDNPPVATVVGESGAGLTPHRASLAAYAQDFVYLAWRNLSDDKYLLMIDDIVVVDEIFVNGFEGTDACLWGTNDPYC